MRHTRKSDTRITKFLDELGTPAAIRLLEDIWKLNVPPMKPDSISRFQPSPRRSLS